MVSNGDAESASTIRVDRYLLYLSIKRRTLVALRESGV